MYIDRNVRLPKLPPDLQRDVDDLTRMYDEGDDCGFLLLEEPVCATIKQAVLDGRITRKEGLALFDYFGWR